MLVYVCNALPYSETLSPHWALRIVVPKCGITGIPVLYGRYVSPSPNVASPAFPCSMGVTYRRPHEPQYTHNSEALNTHWALRIVVPNCGITGTPVLYERYVLPFL